jgi:ParB-like chromosome segregation protein Spo0J
MAKAKRKSGVKDAPGIVPQKYEMVPVGALQPNGWNVNQGDLGSIIQSVQVNRFYGAVLAQKSSGKIIAGEHRWRAAQSEGLQAVPVIWMDVDDDTAKRIMLADNRTSRLGMDDPAALADLLQSLPSLEGTGFDSEALQELLSDMSATPFDGPAEPDPTTPDPKCCPNCGYKLAA